MMRMELEPEAPVCSLTVAQQQMVEIMKAIELDTQIIIMDEPTAALTPVEVSSLFAAMRRLRDEGRTIIYISHRLNEVFDISDRDPAHGGDDKGRGGQPDGRPQAG